MSNPSLGKAQPRRAQRAAAAATLAAVLAGCGGTSLALAPEELFARGRAGRIPQPPPTPSAEPAAAAPTSAPAALDSADASPDDRAVERAAALLDGPEAAAGERMLREELADGTRPADAALVLADHLGRDERLPDALAVLEAALARSPGALDVALAHARVLMDLGRYPEATRELAALYARQPHPRLLVAAATAERAQGHAAAARAHLRTLEEHFADDAWVRVHRGELDAMERDLADVAEGSPRYSPRELLALLRGSDDAVQRVRALRTLAAVRSPELETGLRIALADPAWVVRLDATRAAFALAQDRKSVVAAGLADAAPAVRGAAALLAAELPPDESIPLLLGVLGAEEDGYVLGRMHRALNALTGEHEMLPDLLDDAAKDRMRTYWRKRCRG